MVWFEIEHARLERTDYDSRFESREADVLTLVVNYELLPVAAGEVVFGDLTFGHLQAQPWEPGEFERWKDEWKNLILGAFDEVFELLVYTGSHYTATSRVEMGVSHNFTTNRTGGSVAYRYEATNTSSWELARNQQSDDPITCKLELNEGGGRVHLRIRVAKGGAASAVSGTPYRGVEIAAGGVNADVDRLLLSGDLAPHPDGDTAPARAVHEFGRYLGCWSDASDNQRDLMNHGDEMHAWHGWPWWRRAVDHLDMGQRNEEGRTYYASVVVIRLLATGELSRRTEAENEAAHGSDGDQQALLRNTDQVDPDQIATGVLFGVLGGLALALVVGMAVGVGVWLDEVI